MELKEKELLSKSIEVINKQKAIIDDLRHQVEWALNLLELGQAIIKDQEAKIKELEEKIQAYG